MDAKHALIDDKNDGHSDGVSNLFSKFCDRDFFARRSSVPPCGEVLRGRGAGKVRERLGTGSGQAAELGSKTHGRCQQSVFKSFKRKRFFAMGNCSNIIKSISKCFPMVTLSIFMGNDVNHFKCTSN